jgi:hypothetical protein
MMNSIRQTHRLILLVVRCCVRRRD